MKIKIEQKHDGSFEIKHYHKSGWLAATLKAADEMQLFKLLAGILGVDFIERFGPVREKQSEKV